MTTSKTTDVDILIVGAGPAGLSAALVLGRQQRRVLLVDDGRPRNASVTEMHMYLSRDGDDPAHLRTLAYGEVAGHPNVTVRSGEVTAITGSAGGFHARVVPSGDRSSAEDVDSRIVLLAGGITDDVSGLPGLAERWGRDVHHCAYCHGFESLARQVGVLARTPADIMLSRYIADRFSSDVTVFTGGLGSDDDTAAMISETRARGVRIHPRTPVGLEGRPGRPSIRVAEEGTDGGQDREFEIVFHRPPERQSNTLAEQLGCALTDDGLIAVTPTMTTSVPGVFAAGDAARNPDSPAPMQFVASAVADGQRASVWIEQDLFLKQ
ncbi:MAG: NAD(P)/FAD-dependent oxidoreductase [Brevibacterium sp.]|uniref:NAD(P)/FAD-dependent oxidoreductase n=1 Tax=Brevibacterium linens TaxID=1703 RepID=UPI000FCB522D|nr:NAD(P)/FAD-dependent oxidoreductase [Brevibacterium linens]AZT99672.1 pyridine nucleotide-disulfide oxidoreductase [Brevibacterium linens]MDN5587175.1 NAD(P)/FAD-dependent oxidoreductase [Brevibacterium sp.]